MAMWSDLGICLNYIELDKIEDAKTCVDKLYKDYEMYPEFIAVRKAFYKGHNFIHSGVGVLRDTFHPRFDSKN